MTFDLTRHREALADLCRRHGVRRLDLFGSAARGHDFDPERSDVDVVVEYDGGTAPSLSEFLALREGLERLFGRRVDLVMGSAIRNPYLRAGIDATRVPLHGG
jgi:hypothetical protein